jgi:hypothetical protein
VAKINKPIAYRVDLVEHDRFLGSKLDESLYFDNEEEARNYVQSFNTRNTARTAPEWYMVAEYRVMV